MDHRDPQRIGLADPSLLEETEETGGRRRFGRRLDSPLAGNKKLALTRLGLAVGLGLVFLALLLVGGTAAARFVIDWLHDRPDYQLAFGEIELDPPPPAWINLEREEILERVRKDAGLRESLPALEIALKGIERAFQLHCPWVRRVRKVRRSYPNHLRVELEYREPVAMANWEGNKTVVIDRDAVFLPIAEIDYQVAVHLIQIGGFPPPEDVRPGLEWRSVGSDKLSSSDPALAAAARLSAFLRLRREEATALGEGWAGSAVFLDQSRLFVVMGNRALIRWESFPRAGKANQATDDEKWSLLRDWIASPDGAPVVHPDFLIFTPQGIRRNSEGSESPAVRPHG